MAPTKTEAEDKLGEVLDWIRSQGREPDEWEASRIEFGIQVGLLKRAYTLAFTEAEHALVPRRDRKYQAPRRRSHATLKELQEQLRHAKLMLENRR